jgi:hypothetical protein
MAWYTIKELPSGISPRRARRWGLAWERGGHDDLVRRGKKRALLFSDDAVRRLLVRRTGGRPPRYEPTAAELREAWRKERGSISAVARCFGVSFRYAKRKLVDAGIEI